jgi:hypothetical protein
MRQHSGGRRAAPWVALGAATALGVMYGTVERGRAGADDRAGARRGGEPGVAEARALVAALEARVRSAEANLKQARQLLAQLEVEEKPAAAATTGKDEKPGQADKEAEPIDPRLEGVWRIVSIGGNFGDEFRKPPYDEYKIMSAGHYLWLSFDPATGRVLRSGGGTYTLAGEKYTARVECSNSQDLRSVVGLEYQGTCKLEGKKWYHFGRMPNGAVFDELWERVH